MNRDEQSKAVLSGICSDECEPGPGEELLEGPSGRGQFLQPECVRVRVCACACARAHAHMQNQPTPSPFCNSRVSQVIFTGGKHTIACGCHNFPGDRRADWELSFAASAQRHEWLSDSSFHRLGKGGKSQFQVQLLPNACGFGSVIKSKNPKTSHPKSGTSF